MWKWFNCYLSGRHEYGVWCEPGAVFLRCIHCGRRSAGWSVNETLPGTEKASQPPARSKVTASARNPGRVVAFNRTAVS